MKYLEEVIIKKDQVDLYFEIINNKDLQINKISFSNISESQFIFNHRERFIKIKSLKYCFKIMKYHKSYLNKNEINDINKIFLDTKDPKIISDYVIDSLESELPEAERFILQNSNSIYRYTVKILQKRWKDGEDVIFKNKDDIESIYSYYVKYIYKKEEKGEDFSEIEDLIADNPKFAYKFAQDYIKGRWEKGEKAILTVPSKTFSYIQNVIKKPFPEFEEVLLKDPESSYRYYIFLKNYFRTNWEIGIPTIIKNPEYALLLSENLKSRIPEAEKIIASTAKSAYKYAKNRFYERKTYESIRWIDMKDIDPKIAEEAEKNIFSDGYFASKYITDFIKHRMKDLEHIISKDGEGAYNYAYHFFKQKIRNDYERIRWIDMQDIDPKVAQEAEDSILFNFDSALKYCEDIIKDRWPELEDQIINDDDKALKYAYHVIEGPWPQAGISEEDLGEYYRYNYADQDRD